MKLLTNTNFMQGVFVLFLCISMSTTLSGQSLSQGISGQVIDKESKEAICGAEIIIKNSDPVITVTTNESGYFQFEYIPQGRFYVQAFFGEYKDQPISKVDIYPGTSKVLCIELANNEYSKRTKKGLKTKLKKLTAVLP